jgi:hypothetical protein
MMLAGTLAVRLADLGNVGAGRYAENVIVGRTRHDDLTLRLPSPDCEIG